PPRFREKFFRKSKIGSGRRGRMSLLGDSPIGPRNWLSASRKKAKKPFARSDSGRLEWARIEAAPRSY
ncbi:MAG: hypothetical protein MUF06_18705, partial [Pirellulaceae bacterium]|nr:hypothetical protein [Pirellulaceae bacterium]